MVKHLKVSFFVFVFFVHCTYVVSTFDSLVCVAGCRFCYIDTNFWWFTWQRTQFPFILCNIPHIYKQLILYSTFHKFKR
jgi:hypothetical protein